MATKSRAVSVDLNSVFEGAASQFRGLNPNEPGQWPLLPKAMTWAAVSVAVIVARLVLPAVHRARRARRRARQGADAQERLSRQAGAGRQPERAAQAEAAGRGVRDPAREAAAGQGGDGRAAVRHQPGRARPRPAVRAVPPGPGRDQGLLRRVADLAQGGRPLSRHRLVRRRHREPLAHRHPAQPEHHHAQGQHRRPVDGGDGADLSLPRCRRDRGNSPRRGRGQGQGRRRQAGGGAKP